MCVHLWLVCNALQRETLANAARSSYIAVIGNLGSAKTSEFAMGSFSLVHWAIVLVVVLVLFGRGRVADIMGEFGKGIKGFKQGLNDEVTPTAPPPVQPQAQIPPSPPPSQATLNGDTVIDSSQNGPR
jgi:sec-independent protein translocase protein TatA